MTHNTTPPPDPLLAAIRHHLAELALPSPHDYGMDAALGLEGIEDPETRTAKLTEDFARRLVEEFREALAPRTVAFGGRVVEPAKKGGA